MILNNPRPGSGFGRYAEQLYRATAEYAMFYNLVPPSAGNSVNFPGTKAMGFTERFSGIPFVSKILPLADRILAPYAYKDIRRSAKQFKENGGILHYSYEFVPPLDSSKDNVVTIHDLIPLNEEYNFTFVQRIYSRTLIQYFMKFENIITPSNYVRQDLIKAGSTARIEAIHNPISDRFHQLPEKESLRKKYKLPLKKNLLLSISNSAPWKNLPMVKEVMSRLPDEYVLVRIGEKIGKSIQVTVNSDEELNEIYNACDILLFPTLDEGFGLPVIESFASGLPVVTSEIPVMDEIAGRAAFLAQPNKVESIISGIREVLSNSETYIKKGLKKSEEYSFQKYKDKMRQYYEKL